MRSPSRFRRHGAVLLALACLGSNAAWACSCGQRSIEESFADADAVFRGRAVTVAERPFRPLLLSVRHWLGLEVDFPDYAVQYGMQVRFDVDAAWKGDVPSRAVVYSGRGGGDCGFMFYEGEEYVVFAQRSPSGPLYTTFCAPTERIDDAGAALAFLAGQARREN